MLGFERGHINTVVTITVKIDAASLLQHMWSVVSSWSVLFAPFHPVSRRSAVLTPHCRRQIKETSAEWDGQILCWVRSERKGYFQPASILYQISNNKSGINTHSLHIQPRVVFKPYILPWFGIMNTVIIISKAQNNRPFLQG